MQHMELFLRVIQYSNVNDLRRNLLEETQPLAAHRKFKISEAGLSACRSFSSRAFLS